MLTSDMENEKTNKWIIVLNIIKYVATALIGYFGGNALV